MVNYILVGSYSNDITTLAFDPTTNTLQVTSSLTVGHHPSWIASHNAHPSLVWTGLEQPEGKILAISHDERGNCKVISETSSAGSHPCFLSAVQDELIVANVRSISFLLETKNFGSYIYLVYSIRQELLAFYRYLQTPRNLSHQLSQSSYMVLVQIRPDRKALIHIKLSSTKNIKNFWCQTWVQTASVD